MSRGEAYFSRLKLTLESVVENLRVKGIDEPQSLAKRKSLRLDRFRIKWPAQSYW